MVSSKVDFVPFCHSVLDTESSEFSHLWIPAFAGMTVFGLLTRPAIIERIYGETTGLAPAEQKLLERLYQRRVPADRIVTGELARQMTELSLKINRQIGLLLSRRGEVAFVIVGTHHNLLIPSLDAFRSSSRRFRGLRLIHTHLNGEELTTDDLVDLALLRLDLVCAIEAGEDGLPIRAHIAHLVPENPKGSYWEILPPVHPSSLDTDFTAFILALEGEFAKKLKGRTVVSDERAIIVRVETSPSFDGETSVLELKELCRTAGVDVFDAVIQHRPQIDPRFIMGKGKLSDTVIRALQMDANILVFDHELSASQMSSLTDFTEMKVIDRTQVILDIFARNARSREAKIQVELAQLKYRLPRLTKQDSGLSRLTGGIGGTGPGETKLEIDRRRIRERITRLEKELKDAEKGRGQRRNRRNKRGIPVISIVGYTNAGKSTLLNALTKNSVISEDRLFATLDTKSARLRFPEETEALITDTVGFIRELPKELFAAFRATLDELRDADILLHVIDVANPAFEEQISAVEKILAELELNRKPILHAFNKIDRLADQTTLPALCRRFQAIPVCALAPDTFAPLLNKLARLMKSSFTKGQIYGQSPSREG